MIGQCTIALRGYERQTELEPRRHRQRRSAESVGRNEQCGTADLVFPGVYSERAARHRADLVNGRLPMKPKRGGDTRRGTYTNTAVRERPRSRVGMSKGGPRRPANVANVSRHAARPPAARSAPAHATPTIVSLVGETVRISSAFKTKIIERRM